MIKAVKKFLRTHLVNENHPAVMYFQLLRYDRIYSKAQKRHERMSYAEMESELSEKFMKTFGRPLNWDNPQTYNEKLNVSKLYMPSPLKTRLADKVAVREWIREKIGDEYLIPLLGVYDSFDDIDFDSLPDKFVIKCSHDSGSYTLVKDKSKLNMGMLRQKYKMFMKRNYGWYSLEMHYKDIKPKIIIEEYIETATNNYEFLCLEGKPYFCWVDFDHLIDRRRNIYDMNWEIMPFNMSHCTNYPEYVPCPKEFEVLKDFAMRLSQGFNMVRVDFYLANGKIYFEEMTFSSGSGFSVMSPDEWDYTIGSLWTFDNTVRRKILSERTKP